jgi:hypothetical protein
MVLAPTLTLSAGSGAAIVRPTFSRDFAGEKTLNNGTGPAIAFTRASDATYFDADGVLQTATSDTPRFDHSGGSSLGLLIEEARTNSIRNAQAGGAVVGAPGTMPTNWTAGVVPGITAEVVATNSTGGLNYVDVKYSGTNSSGSAVFPGIIFEPATQVVASASQTWTGSFYAAIVAGGATGISAIRADVYENTAAGVFVTNGNTAITLGSTLARYSHTRTLTDATTARVNGRLFLVVDGSATIDITLRIAAPQLEQGAFPTSYIPTTTAAVTREADSAVVTPISSFYNVSEGTLFAEIQRYATAPSSFTGALSFSTGSDSVSDEIYLSQANSPTNVSTLAFLGVSATGETSRNPTTSAGLTMGQVTLLGAAVKSGDFYVVGKSSGGSQVSASDSGAHVLIAATKMRLGRRANNTTSLNGHIRKIAYWPRRLSNALLQSLTT